MDSMFWAHKALIIIDYDMYMREEEYECPVTSTIYTIMIGENAQDNWDIIAQSSQNDIWFHVENSPSCHIVLSVPPKVKTAHRSVYKYCAGLCKEGSKVKNAKAVSIIYTEIKNVTIDKKGATGSVFTRKTKKIIV